jgi:protease IV
MDTPQPPRPAAPPQPSPLAPHYIYPPPPRPGFLVTLLRLGGVVIVLLLVFVLGSQSAVLALRMGNVVVPSSYRAGEGSDKIAIIPISGIIDSYLAEHMQRVVESVLRDHSIKAVVLRVESPGGGASASDQILHELNRIKVDRGLPMIASYGGYAASGGYYVSCQAQKIFAEPTCVTGSIGVIAQVPTFQVLLEEKLGVQVEVITATGSPEKDTANTYYRSWTETDRAAMRKLIDAVHLRFVDVVAAGRKGVLERDRVAELANGEAYTAAEAKAHGLIDEIGYLDAALVYAAQEGPFTTDNPPVVYYHPPTALFDVFGFQGRSAAPAGHAPQGWEKLLDASAARQWFKQMAVPEIVMMFNP